jgi:hypothetical protein
MRGCIACTLVCVKAGDIAVPETSDQDAKDGEKNKRLDMVRWMASYQYFAIAAETAEVASSDGGEESSNNTSNEAARLAELVATTTRVLGPSPRELRALFESLGAVCNLDPRELAEARAAAATSRRRQTAPPPSVRPRRTTSPARRQLRRKDSVWIEKNKRKSSLWITGQLLIEELGGGKRAVEPRLPAVGFEDGEKMGASTKVDAEDGWAPSVVAGLVRTRRPQPSGQTRAGSGLHARSRSVFKLPGGASRYSSCELCLRVRRGADRAVSGCIGFPHRVVGAAFNKRNNPASFIHPSGRGCYIHFCSIWVDWDQFIR